MKLPNFALKNYQFTLILLALATLVGWFSFQSMPRSEDPKPDFPIYNIVVVYPGAGPIDMEELVVDPIEDALEEIEDIETVNTSIKDGLVTINVEGTFGIDTQDKLNEITREINAIRADLPDEIFGLGIVQFDPNILVNIMQIALYSEAAPYNQLRRIAEDLEYELNKISGISGVEVEAEPQEEIRISLDFQQMARQNISLQQVVGILQQQNVNIPGGDVKSSSKSFTIKTSGGYKSLDHIKKTVISSTNTDLVHLDDIADVRFDYEDLRWKASYMGEKAVYVTITQKPNENVVTLSEEINGILSEFQSTLPTGIQLVKVFEQAEAVSLRLSDFFTNLLQGISLVGLIILLFFGFRPAAIIMTVIPLSIIIAIAGIDFSGYALQQISIAALVIALGLLVDNGIVVVENILRFRRMGHSIAEAAIQGTAEVSSAIISSTVTTVLAFAPLALLNSASGEFLRSLPVTVILVLIVSLIIALTFTPIISGKFLGKKSEHSGLINPALKAISEKSYLPTLKLALRKPFVFIAGALIFFFTAFALFPYVGVSFFPTADKPMLLIEVDTPNGSNIDVTEQGVLFVESVIQQTEGIRDYATNIGHGNPMVYYNRPGTNYERTHGQVLVNFEEWNPEQFYSTLAEFRRQFSSYPDAKITFSELKNGPPFAAPVEIKIIGDNLDVLKNIAFDVENIISNTEGTLNVENPLAVSKTNLKVNVDLDRAALFGVTVLDTDVALRASLAGYNVGDVTLDNSEEYPMIVRLPNDGDAQITDFNKVYFSNRHQQQVPFRQVANLEFESTVNEIQHFDFQRSIAVTADVKNPDKTTAITESIIEELNTLELPQGYSLYIGGEYEAQQETFGDLGMLLILSMLGIFAVLVLQFRSFKQPLIVFAAIPLAVTGSFFALFITGWSFSFIAFVGFISLVGIVVNNSIILVDYSNQLMAQGKSKLEAIQEGSATRFVPIILTTSTTILGLLPLTLSKTSLWSPLGWTIIGGMISSTFLTLIIVPILYNWFTSEAQLVNS